MSILDEPISMIMTPNVEVAHPGQKLSEVRQMMVASGGHHVPVVENGRFLGLIAPSDLLRIVPINAYTLDSDGYDEALDKHSVLAAMAEDVMTIAPQETVQAAAEILLDGSFHCLPVVDDGGRLVGIVTTTDFVRLLLQLAGKSPRVKP